MSAERLREAARVLRERAEAATPGPWALFDDDSYGPPNLDEPMLCSHAPIVRNIVVENGEITRPNADYIATMHPGVGLALADWLDKYADLLDRARDINRPAYADQARADAVADQILGSTS